MFRLRLIQNILLGIRSLMIHKLRSFLTVLGMVFGVGSVIAMLSVGEGASREALDQIRKLGSTNIIINSIEPLDDGIATTRPGYLNTYGLLYEDEQRILKTIPSVRTTVPVKAIRKDAFLGDRSLELRIVGTTPQWFELVKRPVIAGRTLSQQDIETRAGVCVLTEHGARKLLATEHSVGQAIRIGSHYYTVVGIVRSEQGTESAQLPDQATDAYMPISTARERYGDTTWDNTPGSQSTERVELHQLIVQVESTDEVEPAAAAIQSMLERFHKKRDFQIRVPLGLLKQAEATKRRFNIVLGSIAAISLLVGGIGIMNIMLASILERTREIGIRRAIGAKRNQIVGQFLIETVVLSTVGGLIGTAFGFLLPWLITHFSGMPTFIPLYSILLSLSISVGIGILFGLYPAMRAARLNPIVALRHE